MTHKSLLTFSDWQPHEAEQLLVLALDVKRAPHKYAQSLAGKSLIALFEKPSLRTRVSFDIGINKLGGHLVYLDSQSNNLAGREDVRDMGANFACWADAIIARVFSHDTLKALDDSADIPVINALCDKYHPCQALADYLGMYETFGKVKGLTLAYVGDGNNVTHSLLILGALLGCHQWVVTPEGYEVDAGILAVAKAIAEKTNTQIHVTNSIAEMSENSNGVDVIYTDTWLSMGDDTPLADIKETFMPYQVNEALLAGCNTKYVMHCQPAHRDLEITGSLMDSKASLLMLQAENRMHAQNAILVQLLAND
ncbi:ornithine carbamoyltransferase [Alteromonas facilis]|uniref:ornithine carbamoyltransferase n=1 Tax=Alteromonas facilis TaxID=2048004 RepID=UPI000C292D3A|nr:ornithine carbamoyltransferase [Alteromonas facilis]